MHGGLLGDDAALLLRALLLVPFDHIDAAHQGAAVIGAHLDHLAGAALVAAGEHDHLIALADFRRHHSTSGASEMRSEEHTSELQSLRHLVCRLLLEKKK